MGLRDCWGWCARNLGCGAWGFGVLDKMAEKQDMRPFVASPSSSCMEEGRKECFFAPPPTPQPLNFSSMHVPQHFTGIWALGKLRRPGKSLITLELPIGYDCYRGFENFSKEATEWHLHSLRSLIMIQSDPFAEGSSGLICSAPLRRAATLLVVEIHQDKAM